jgi:hypothetical protein
MLLLMLQHPTLHLLLCACLLAAAYRQAMMCSLARLCRR